MSYLLQYKSDNILQHLLVSMVTNTNPNKNQIKVWNPMKFCKICWSGECDPGHFPNHRWLALLRLVPISHTMHLPLCGHMVCSDAQCIVLYVICTLLHWIIKHSTALCQSHTQCFSLCVRHMMMHCNALWGSTELHPPSLAELFLCCLTLICWCSTLKSHAQCIFFYTAMSSSHT